MTMGPKERGVFLYVVAYGPFISCFFAWDRQRQVLGGWKMRQKAGNAADRNWGESSVRKALVF